MKKRILIYAAAVAALAVSCTKEEAHYNDVISSSPVFCATFEPLTKAELNTVSYNVEWQDGDEVAIVDAAGGKAVYLAAPDVENPAAATLTIKEGETALGSGPYTAYYPATTVDGLPGVVIQHNGQTNDIDSLPMAAVSEDTSLSFHNLCSVLKVTLPAQSGYNFKSISFMSESKTLSGKFTVGHDGRAVVSAEGLHYHALSRANALKMDADQVYYVALPAGEYDDLRIRVSNNAGGDQVFDLKSTLTLERNTIYPLTLKCSGFRVNLSRDASLTDPDKLYYHVDDTKTANCYQATSASGKYKFFPTAGDGGEPVEGIKSVKVLWEAQAGTTAPAVGVVVKNAVYNKGYIEFDAGGSQGNAVVAAYDGENGTGKILWSWHIWRANTAFSNVVYPHGETMMDRNVGAFGNGANSVNSIGVYFQYGRKDPFTGKANNNNQFAAQNGIQRTIVDERVSVQTSIENPTKFYINSVQGTNWSTELDKATWDGPAKTAYDPCPHGYRVPLRAVWTTDGSAIDAKGFSTWANNGTVYNGQNYVSTGQVDPKKGTMNSSSLIVFMWTREINPSGNAYILDVRSDGSKKFSGAARANSVGLRCQKIE